MIEIYTDGSATKTRSGWGFVALVDGEKVYTEAGFGDVGDTNQIMELTAAIEACSWAFNSDYIKEHDVIIYSDSAYVINCYQDRWYINWENNGWKNSKGDLIINLPEWANLIGYFKMPNFDFKKVKGHSGHVYNELADKLATGKVLPSDTLDLTTNKKYDTIYIELSEILLNYSMKKFDTKYTIESIIKLMNREGACLYKDE